MTAEEEERLARERMTMDYPIVFDRLPDAILNPPADEPPAELNLPQA